jgi:diguanylate cyclase (GGDEF)-like protein
MEQVPLGAKIRITGISMYYSSDPFNGPLASNILLRSFADITVIAKPPWLSIENLIRIVIALLLVVIAIFAWGWTLRGKVHRQTAALAGRIKAEAELERRRSRILEDINGSRPLAEIIELITDLVSFKLEGAPSWCEIKDGARLGNYPPEPHRLRIVSEEIPGRSGPPLGVLFAGIGPGTGTPPVAGETATLAVGTRLATLAIETLRLHADLVHRSEFDQLTGIHNRFSLDKHLDQLIEQARQNAGIFGLFYIDLDDFKQVNDLYGHHVGDLYLQQVTLRLKQQLRSGDMLARQGGDEFALLVPVVRNQAASVEIALRLDHCFDDPFVVEGSVLRGSASIGIALYPEDGTTKESMLSAADAAMYVAKHNCRQIAETPELLPKTGIAREDRA